MTERKPAHMSFDSWIDAQIREAQERGEFDNLPGKGKPIKGLDEPYDELWWVKQLMIREEISYLPPALAVRREAEQLLDAVGALPSERAVRESVDELNVRIREMNRKPGLDGPPSTLMPLDVEVVIRRWKAARAELAERRAVAAAEAAAAAAAAATAAATAAAAAGAVEDTPAELAGTRRRRWWLSRRGAATG